jgi:hypothetical protein
MASIHANGHLNIGGLKDITSLGVTWHSVSRVDRCKTMAPVSADFVADNNPVTSWSLGFEWKLKRFVTKFNKCSNNKCSRWDMASSAVGDAFATSPLGDGSLKIAKTSL